MFHNRTSRVILSLSKSISKQSSIIPRRVVITPHLNNNNTTPILLSQRNLSTAKLIQELRKATGAPMVECKKAISDPEVNGDFEKATEWLRKHGSAKMSSKLAGRDASEGLVGISINDDGSIISIVRVNSETDFASRSQVFSDLVETVAGASLGMSDNNKSSDNNVSIVDELKEVSHVKEALDNAIVSIRENLQIASASLIVASKPSSSVLTGYVHGKIFNDKSVGTAAAIVELAAIDSNTKSKEEITDIGKKLSMHIVAARPEYMKPDDVPTEIIEKEKEILMEQMGDSGKPKEILEKIVNGKMNKFYQGVCLLEQSHMLEEGNPKVSKFLKDQGLELISYELVNIE